MKKRLLTLLLLTIILFSSTTVMAKEDLKIKVNGRLVETDVSPFAENNRTYVPVRFIVEALGGTVDFDAESYGTPAVIIYDENNGEILWLTLFIGHRKALVSEGVYANDVPPIVRNERTMVPVRFLATYLGCKVGWDGDTHTIYIDQVGNYDSFERYYDDLASQKIGDWLMDPNHTTEQFLKILK